MHTDLGYLADTVRIEDGKWELKREDGGSVGLALPFTASETNMVPPQKYEFSTFDYHSVCNWTIDDSGSVWVRRAAYLTFSDEEKV